MCISRRQRGMTLIELIVFIVIVSVALAGVLTVLNVTAKSSADPMIRKQMLAVAEGLLEEVELRPFTWCDPDDPQAATAISNAVGASGCTGAASVENIGPETGETRTNATTPFDNVNDYNGCGPGVAACNLASPIPSVTGTSFAPAGYSATVAVAQAALSTVAAANSLLITVTVCHAATCPSAGADSIVLEGYRTRYSPNTLP